MTYDALKMAKKALFLLSELNGGEAIPFLGEMDRFGADEAGLPHDEVCSIMDMNHSESGRLDEVKTALAWASEEVGYPDSPEEWGEDEEIAMDEAESRLWDFIWGVADDRHSLEEALED
jgi:hypothetical protein